MINGEDHWKEKMDDYNLLFKLQEIEFKNNDIVTGGDNLLSYRCARG